MPAKMLQPCPTLVTLQIVASQAPLSKGILKQEYWCELPWPPRGDLPDPGIDPMSLMSPALAGRFFATNATLEAPKESGSASCSVVSNSLQTHGLAHQAPLSMELFRQEYWSG